MSVGDGDMAPDFEMPATGGRTVSLAALKGKPFVLYFYPKADTPGCTKEACNFRDRWSSLQEHGIEVLGISIKTVEKHRGHLMEKLGIHNTASLTRYATTTGIAHA